MLGGKEAPWSKELIGFRRLWPKWCCLPRRPLTLAVCSAGGSAGKAPPRQGSADPVTVNLSVCLSGVPGNVSHACGASEPREPRRQLLPWFRSLARAQGAVWEA